MVSGTSVELHGLGGGVSPAARGSGFARSWAANNAACCNPLSGVRRRSRGTAKERGGTHYLDMYIGAYVTAHTLLHPKVNPGSSRRVHIIGVTSGLVILDNDCLKFLESAESQGQLRANCRVADFQLRLSHVNAFEILQTASDHVRERLIRTFDSLRDGMPLLPWPPDLLRPAGEAIATGKPHFSYAPSGIEAYMNPGAVLSQDLREKVASFLTGETAWFDGMYDSARSRIQTHIKKDPRLQEQLRNAGTRDLWVDAPHFLNEFWMAPEVIRPFVEGIWERLELPKGPSPEKVLTNPTWRIYLEALGLAAYERSFVFEQPRRVHFPDLMQLVYLGAVRRGVLLTHDVHFRRAASSLLLGRYKGVRIFDITEYLALAAR